MRVKLNKAEPKEWTDSGLGAERRGAVVSSGSYFGARQLLADIEAASTCLPAAEDRPTQPGPSDDFCRSRPEPLSASKKLAAKVREHGGANLEPMQFAALLIEKTIEQLSEREAEELIRPKRHAGH